MTPTRQHAALRINDKCYKYSDEKFEKLIIHEMLHPLFYPIVREYERSSTTSDTYHDEAVETTIDHLSNVLYNVSNK